MAPASLPRLAFLLGLAAATVATAAPAPPAPSRGPNYAGRIAATIEPTRSVIYKRTDSVELRIDVFEPSGLRPGDRRAAFVAFHGGGWTAGVPRAMYAFTDWAAKRGLVAFSVQYRLYRPEGPYTVFDCVKDGRDAVRWVRAHAVELGVDPHRIAVSGASAGGHVAAATAMFHYDEPNADIRISCRPDALILYSPVIDTSAEGYGRAKVGERWADLSPRHQVREGMPPTLLFHGTGDETTPFLGARIFVEKMREAGNRCDAVFIEGAPHTYMFKDAALYAETLERTGRFLQDLGFLPPAMAHP